MKRFIFALSILLSVILFISGCTNKETPKDVKAVSPEMETLKEIKDNLTNLQNSVADIKNSATDIQNSQKEILARISDLEKKISTVQAQAAPARPTVDFNKIYNLPVVSSAVKGNKNAPAAIVEFSDFQCPYCSQLQQTLSEVLKAYPKEAKLVFKHYPLPFHQQAMNAAKAAEAAKEQGKFWEMHDLIFQNFNKLNDGIYKELAQQIGLNVEKFSADFSSNKYDQLIQQDMALARSAGVTGTPTLFINGKRMQQRSLNDFKQSIDSILKK
ncbi:MAG: thioredoxin domain-containing protein [Nitrospirae bacterium]|nr:thioredoxin domain-containing protein [Nitrospirota bacterium]